MEKIKILQFPIANAKGGVTQYVMNNWDYIDRNRFQFDFATLSSKLDFAEELEKEGCKIHYISCYAEENKDKFIEEMDRILEEGYDVVHLHTNWWKSFLVEELARKHNIPKIIVHSHNTMVDVKEDEQRNYEIKRHYELRELVDPSIATDFYACSRKAADWLYGEQVPKEQIQILKYGIPVEKFVYDEKTRNRMRSELKIENKYVIGHVGRFVYQKNHEFLIHVFHKVSEQIDNAVLLLAGTGKLEEAVREQVKNAGLEDRVLFLGKRSDIGDLMQAMDVFVLPSRFEGFGIVLIEAQAAGLKCICSTEVPEEAHITDNISFVPLEEKEWIKDVTELQKPYVRHNMYQVMTDAGFNNSQEIKRLENLYSSGIGAAEI